MNARAIFSVTIRCLLLAALAGAASGCSTKSGNIFTPFSLDDGTSVSTGSRQRLVVNTSPEATPRPGLVQPKRIICAEPSPDVASTVANSFGSGLSIFGWGSGAVSASEAEGLIQLAERTVTVQLLRDQMYRACEAYANGAITGTTYSLITSKNNKTMVSLLLGEIAGGGIGRKLGALGGSSKAEVRSAMQGHLKDSEKARKASEELQNAETDLEEAEGLPADDTTKAGKVEAAKSKRDAAAQKLQNTAVAASNSSAEIATVIAGGQIDIKASPELATVLKDMQEQFLNSDFLEDFVSTCLVELGLNSEQKHYFDPVNVVFRTKHQYYATKLDESQSEEVVAAERALDTALIRLNDSYLSRLCKKELPILLEKRQQQGLERARNEHVVQLVAEHRTTLEALTKALEQCSTLQDGDGSRKTCRDTVVSLAKSGLSNEVTATSDDKHHSFSVNELHASAYASVWLPFVDLTILDEQGFRLNASIVGSKDEEVDKDVLRRRDKEKLDLMKKSFVQKYRWIAKEVPAYP